MTIFGNIFLVLATLLFFLLLSTVYGKAPSGPDSGMGYTWGLIIFNLAFLACIFVVAIAIASKGGFDWVSDSKSSRYLLVYGGLIMAIFAATLTGLFRYESGPVPTWVRVLSGFLPVWVPLLLLVAGAVLLNDGLRTTLPAAVYQWPLWFVFGLGALTTGGSLLWWMVEANKDAAHRVESMREDEKRYHQKHLDEIDSCDVSQNMVFILVFTDANHDADVREKALAKIKTHPDWQKEMIRLLECDWAPQALNFMASNEVDDKQRFIEPLRKGILIQAKLVEKYMGGSSYSTSFYPELFSWEVERVLRAVDRFKDTGADYRQEVKALRAALDAPSESEKPVFKCVGMLERWLAQHR